MELVCKFYQDDVDIFGYSQYYFVEVFCLGFGFGFKFDCIDFRYVVYQFGNNFVECFSEGFFGYVGVFDDVMEQCSLNVLCVYVYIREDFIDCQRMNYIGVVVMSELVFVGVFSEIISVMNIFFLFRWKIFKFFYK